MKKYTATINSPLGKIKITTDEKHLLEICFVSSGKNSSEQPRVLKETAKQLNEYFSGKRERFVIPISWKKLDATTFQIEAWKTLKKIPFVKTISYGEQAKKVGTPKACRAVGSANGKNPLPIIIPCHRVIRGQTPPSSTPRKLRSSPTKKRRNLTPAVLGGFSSGIWRKKILLRHELSSQ